MTMGLTYGKRLGIMPTYFLYITLFYSVVAQEQQESPEIIRVSDSKSDLKGNATLACLVAPAASELTWLFNGTPLKSNDRINIKISPQEGDYKESTLFFSTTNKSDAGNYTCFASFGGQNDSKQATLDLTFPARFATNKTKYDVTATKSDKKKNVQLECIFEIYNNPGLIEWRPPKNGESQLRNATWLNETNIASTYDIERVNYLDNNGSYECAVFDDVTGKNVTGSIDLVVVGDPRMDVNVTAIGKSRLFVNWTIDAANSKIESITCVYGPDETKLHYTPDKIPTSNTSYVIKDLEPSTNYKVRMNVTTKHSDYVSPFFNDTTLENDPVFVPNISINGFSATSVTIGWAPPPKEIEKYIHYYLLEASKKDEPPMKAYHSRDSRNLPYMFDSLEPHSTYTFKVRACQDYTKECGNWSNAMEAATLDGVPGKPSAVRHSCSASQLLIAWAPPLKPNAEIKGYTMELTGLAEYNDTNGKVKKDTWGPLSRFVGHEKREARFDDLQPNTNYTVRLSAMTRTRRRGEEALLQCRTRAAPPARPPRPRWTKIMDKDRYLFKMHLPKVSERNGPICCYRVYMVRMLSSMNLKNPQQLEVIEYEEAHAAVPVGGAYVTDIFTNYNFPADSELVLGDSHSIFNRSTISAECRRCLLARAPPPAPEPPTAAAPPTTAVPPTTAEPDDDSATDTGRQRRHQPHTDSFSQYADMPTMQDAPKASDVEREVSVKDGPLDSSSNYTVFVELIPYPVDNQSVEAMYSDFLNQLMPAPSPVAPVPHSMLEIALQATCAVAALVLLVLVICCVLHTQRSRKLPPHANFEMSSIQRALRYVWPPYSRYPAPLPAPPELPPIPREELSHAYAKRHADSDYEFQKEFEQLQMLSECFADRTTHASEARENQSKNRYPDIKAYDQTRVKLAQVDGITGSDYINANYVMGYKERKKFICAQGPTDTTVNDFWRMIWEHGLELIVMLTNLEEYSKVKCSKYWPDEVRGSRAFGAITVQHVSEKRYSDYIVRELKITKQPTNAEGQPIVENNGVAKRNGDVKEAHESAPTSPRSPKETALESRTVRQYHFLMWKDFAAPEHPHSILKFIKRVNEAWSSMVPRPCVVHCSAGVGRTGTLVALDCLLDQLRATGHVAVFNTVAELRRQRNFLVQSQKQYVFVYRALVEYAHYGDTEIPASKLKPTIDRLRNTPEGADKCAMEQEFEKLLNSPVVEVVKSCAAGQAEELRTKNRSADCLPYDRNRVMLAPIPGRDYSTYINASFVEAYDNSEGFIITQDPLPNTIFDFWRMVSEQSVSTIVMLSELGEGKCPRYWDDGTATYEHIAVQYDESESCPYYTRRQFRVTNNKTGHTTTVRQLQYQGWPTAPGHVPEVTRGLAELADASTSAGDQLTPMLVHCNLGTERSALFVALCTLICQLRTERRADVSCVARKVRAQRQHTIDTFTQYEFLHRAILNYAELHNLLEDS